MIAPLQDSQDLNNVDAKKSMITFSNVSYPKAATSQATSTISGFTVAFDNSVWQLRNSACPQKRSQTFWQLSWKHLEIAGLAAKPSQGCKLKHWKHGNITTLQSQDSWKEQLYFLNANTEVTVQHNLKKRGVYITEPEHKMVELYLFYLTAQRLHSKFCFPQLCLNQGLPGFPSGELYLNWHVAWESSETH